MPKKKDRTSQLSIILNEDQQKKLRALSDITLAPMNALVRQALDLYLEMRKDDLKPKR